MKLERLADLFVYTESLRKRTLVSVNAVDLHTLEAISEAIKLGIVSGVVTGNRDEIIKLCIAHHIDHQSFQIIHAENEEDAARLAIDLVKQIPDSILMKGLISSDNI